MRPIEMYAKRPALAVALCMVLATLLPLVGGWVFYAQSDTTVRQQQARMVDQSLQLTLQKLDADLDEMASIAFRLKRKISGLELPDFGALRDEDRITLFEARGVLREYLSDAPAIIRDVFVVRAGVDYALGAGSMLSYDRLCKKIWNDQITPEALYALLTAQAESGLYRVGENDLVFLMPMSKSPAPATQGRTLVFVLNGSYMEGIARNYGLPGAQYTMRSRDGEYLSQSSPGDPEATTVTRPFSYGNYALTVSVPSAYYHQNSLSLRILYYGLLFLTLIMCVILIWALSRRTVMPIQNLIQYIEDNYRTDTQQEVEGLNLVFNAVEQMLNEHAMHRQQLAHYQEETEMHELADAFLGYGRLTENGRYYVVACVMSQTEPDIEKLRVLSFPGYHASFVSLPRGMYMLFVKQDGQMDEREAEAGLESMLEAMDNLGYANAACAMSLVHCSTDEIETAYREAVMAADCMEYGQEAPVLCFDTIRYSPEYFLRDWHHLDKQLTFAHLIGDKAYDEALELLPSLFPEEFLRNARSTLAQLHLSSLKYQFIHDAEGFTKDSADALEISRTLSKRIISCKNHAELLDFMRKLLQEMDAGQSKSAEPPDEMVQKVKAYIRRNSKETNLSVTAISEVFSIPIDQLSRAFSKHADTGVLQYIHKIRIEEACGLLLSDEGLMIGEIAQRVGYSSALTFTRAFKARYRMTPSEYRRLHAER